MEDSTPGVIEYEGDEARQGTCRLMMACATLGALRAEAQEDAEIIFSAIEPLAKNKPAFALSRAMTLALSGGAETAVEMMNARLEANPDDDLAKVGLGVAMLFADHPDWSFNIDNVLATSVDQAARQAALTTITYVPAMMRAGRSLRATIRPS